MESLLILAIDDFVIHYFFNLIPDIIHFQDHGNTTYLYNVNNASLLFILFLSIIIQRFFDPFHYGCHQVIRGKIENAGDNERHEGCLRGGGQALGFLLYRRRRLPQSLDRVH